MSTQAPKVAWLMGSDSDLPHLEKAFEVLDGLGVPYEVRVLSAHRTPDRVREYVAQSEASGVMVFIAAAGSAAHLAGAVAAATTRPVIGVPMPSAPLNGLDALLSTVQMPAGIPVACMAVGAGGAKNAALFAAQVLATSDQALALKVTAERAASAENVARKDSAVRAKFGVGKK